MNKTYEEMISELEKMINNQHSELHESIASLRHDLNSEVTRIKTKIANLGEALAILANESSQKPQGSKLSPEIYERIMHWINKRENS